MDRLPRVTPGRLATLAAGVLCLDVAVAVGLRLRRVRGAVALDVRTAQPVFAHAFGVSLVPVRLAREFVKLGNPAPFAVAVVALGLVALGWQDRAGAATSFVAPPAAVWSAERLKTVFGRTEGGFDNYPSGHTTALTALATAIVVLAWRRWGPRSLLATGPIAAVLAGGMVLSVVRIHAHLMSDALGGVLVGAGIVTVTAALAAFAVDRPPGDDLDTLSHSN